MKKQLKYQIEISDKVCELLEEYDYKLPLINYDNVSGEKVLFIQEDRRKKVVTWGLRRIMKNHVSVRTSYVEITFEELKDFLKKPLVQPFSSGKTFKVIVPMYYNDRRRKQDIKKVEEMLLSTFGGFSARIVHGAWQEKLNDYEKLTYRDKNVEYEMLIDKNTTQEGAEDLAMQLQILFGHMFDAMQQKALSISYDGEMIIFNKKQIVEVIRYLEGVFTNE